MLPTPASGSVPVIQPEPDGATAIVVGADVRGSALAVALAQVGLAVVLCDDVDPPWARRGMSFTDAWYYGSARLDGVTAVFCANLKSIPSLLHRKSQIAATTWSWLGVSRMLPIVALIDARRCFRGMYGDRNTAVRPDQVAVTVGGDGFAAVGDALHGEIHPSRRTEVGSAFVHEWQDGDDSAPDVAAVFASAAGRFVTSCRIGCEVAKGEVVGGLDGVAIHAPASGTIRALVAKGARVRARDLLVEVDPRGGPASCVGIPRESRLQAAVVVARLREALGLWRADNPIEVHSVRSLSSR